MGENGTLFLIVVGVAGFLLAFTLKGIFARLKELSAKDDAIAERTDQKHDKLAEQLNDLEKDLRDRYPTKEDLRELRSEVREGTQRIIDLIKHLTPHREDQ